MLIQMAQTGQLGGRIGEDELIGLLGMYLCVNNSVICTKFEYLVIPYPYV